MQCAWEENEAYEPFRFITAQTVQPPGVPPHVATFVDTLVAGTIEYGVKAASRRPGEPATSKAVVVAGIRRIGDAESVFLLLDELQSVEFRADALVSRYRVPVKTRAELLAQNLRDLELTQYRGACRW